MTGGSIISANGGREKDIWTETKPDGIIISRSFGSGRYIATSELVQSPFASTFNKLTCPLPISTCPEKFLSTQHKINSFAPGLTRSVNVSPKPSFQTGVDVSYTTDVAKRSNFGALSTWRVTLGSHKSLLVFPTGNKYLPANTLTWHLRAYFVKFPESSNVIEPNPPHASKILFCVSKGSIILATETFKNPTSSRRS